MSERNVDDPLDDVARKIRLVNDGLRPGGYLGIAYQGDPEHILRGEHAWLHGGMKPTIFRTLKGAHDNIGLYSSSVPEKIVVMLDLELLPVVHSDRPIEKRRGFTEAAFAERQMELWTRRAEQLLKAEKAGGK